MAKFTNIVGCTVEDRLALFSLNEIDAKKVKTWLKMLIFISRLISSTTYLCSVQ